MAKEKGTLKWGDLSPTSPFSRFRIDRSNGCRTCRLEEYIRNDTELLNLAPAIAADAYDIYTTQQSSVAKQKSPFLAITGVDNPVRTIYNSRSTRSSVLQTGVIQ
jgi:hypothetical protein